MSILHGSFWKHLKSIRSDGDKEAYEARIPVLMFLISSGDTKRNRTFHGVETIMQCTGYSKAPVTEALGWLSDHGAIYNVPKEARIGNEKRIHGNRKVWQLTGILQLGDAIIDYLYLKEEDRESSLIELSDHAPLNVKMMLHKLGLIDKPTEISSQDEPNLSSQNDTENSEIGSQNAPEIGSQNDTAKELGKKNLVGGELDKPPASDRQPFSEYDARAIITAWQEHTNLQVELLNALNNTYYIDTALKLLEDLGATIEEVRATTIEQVPKSRKGTYQFKFLLDDIPERRNRKNIVSEAKQRTDDAHNKVLREMQEQQARIEALKKERQEKPLGETA